MILISLFASKKFWSTVKIILLFISALSILEMAQAADRLLPESNDRVPYRLLMPLLQPVQLPGAEPQLTVGSELPALPVELPIPQSGQLQWSLVDRPQHFTLLFEVPESRSPAEAIYLEQLQASGWRPWSIEQFHQDLQQRQPGEALNTGGLMILGDLRYGSEGPDSSEAPLERLAKSLTFFKPGTDAQLSLFFSEPGPNRSNLKIYLTIRQSNSTEAAGESTLLEMVPELGLQPPSDTLADWITGRASESDLSSLERIQTSLPLSKLVDHYASQMRQQGWILQTSSGDDRLQWSIWSRTDSSGVSLQGTIHLFATEKPNQYIGAFSIQKIPENFGSLARQPADIQPGALPKAAALQVLRDRWQVPDSEPYELWLEQLPPVLSATVSVPSETAVLGGASRADAEVAILETSLHSGTVQMFYREWLTEAGWRTPESLHSPEDIVVKASGFPTFLPDVFCNAEEGKEITVNLQPEINDLLTIQLTLSPSEAFSRCRVDPNSYSFRHQDSLVNVPVPYLQTPPETSLISGDTTFMETAFNSRAYLQSDLTAEILANHYAQQLRQAGWTQLRATQSEDSRVSLWRTEMETRNVWQGLLSLIAQPSTGQWTGHFYATIENIASE